MSLSAKSQLMPAEPRRHLLRAVPTPARTVPTAAQRQPSLPRGRSSSATGIGHSRAWQLCCEAICSSGWAVHEQMAKGLTLLQAGSWWPQGPAEASSYLSYLKSPHPSPRSSHLLAWSKYLALWLSSSLGFASISTLGDAKTAPLPYIFWICTKRKCVFKITVHLFLSSHGVMVAHGLSELLSSSDRAHWSADVAKNCWTTGLSD